MPNRLDLQLTDWKRELAAEPAALATAAAPDVRASADAAANALRAAYPIGPTGNLRARVHVEQEPGDPAVAQTVVVSGAPHAHLYEDGTRYARAHPTFYPITDQHARDWQSSVSSVVDAHGYRVTGAID